MSFNKKDLPTTNLQKQLGYAHYLTAWSMMHRIRNAMGNRDNLYQLEGMMEFDEGYFSTETKEINKTISRARAVGNKQL